ncbi:MAG: hypothetical protein V1798_01360 [Pseudomonadota bacterium]
MPRPWADEKQSIRMLVPVEPTLHEILSQRMMEVGFENMTDYVRWVLLNDLLEGPERIIGERR